MVLTNEIDMCAFRHETDTYTLENQTNQKSNFSDCIPDTVYISTIPQHYIVIFNPRDQCFLLLFFLLSDCKKISGGRSGGSTAGSDTRTSPGVPRLPGPLIKAKRGSLWHRPLFVHGLDAMTVVGKKKRLK